MSEIDLGPGDGLALVAEARKQPWGKDLPWVVYTRRQERAIAQKAFELGVLDYVTKPASADLLVAKLKALLEQRASASPQHDARGQRIAPRDGAAGHGADALSRAKERQA